MNLFIEEDQEADAQENIHSKTNEKKKVTIIPEEIVIALTTELSTGKVHIGKGASVTVQVEAGARVEKEEEIGKDLKMFTS